MMIDTIDPHDLDGLLRNATAWRVTVERLAQELERDEATSASFPSCGRHRECVARASGARPFFSGG